MSQNAAPAQMSRGCCHDPIRSEGSLIPRIFDGGLGGSRTGEQGQDCSLEQDDFHEAGPPYGFASLYEGAKDDMPHVAGMGGGGKPVPRGVREKKEFPAHFSGYTYAILNKKL